MRATRSATRAASASDVPNPKRTADTQQSPTAPAKKPRTTKEKKNAVPSAADPATIPPVPNIPAPATPPVLLPAVLSFSFEDAKKHLVDADARWVDIFQRMPCRPFEHLERVEPFRTLTVSILGQQISWLAARSITHRFIRLYNPSMPEKPGDSTSSKADDFFPSPQQVAATEIVTLKSAGLSTRKAEYIKDLAARFADGRLSTQKLHDADDEALAEMLIAVRGIGRWTVDMFAIFSLRRPDILPVGDLGVQRGMARWFLSRHSSAPQDQYAISPKKLPKSTTDQEEEQQQQPQEDNVAVKARSTEVPNTPPPDASSIPPVPTAFPLVPSTEPPSTPRKGGRGGGGESRGASLPLPTPFTPSINRVLAGPSATQPDSGTTSTLTHGAPPPLPAGLTVAELKSRASGKKKVKGALLMPAEMEALTEEWRPYRSLGVYYMWALVEEPAT